MPDDLRLAPPLAALHGVTVRAGPREVLSRVDLAVGRGEIVTVVGRHCESGDILVDGVPLDTPRVDDLLVVPATGAYCYTMSNNYNGNRRIPVVFVASGTPTLVVRRETWDDLAARDVS